MNLTRRQTLMVGVGAVAAGYITPNSANASVEEAVNAFTGGKSTIGSGITLTTPEIAENGNTVPIEVNAPGATSIIILAAGNPNPRVVTFNFGKLAGEQFASTRIRLAKTQDVIAIAKMADGSFVQTSQEVKVTIGGCGG